jgi:uncharacterized membrane protein
MNINRNQNLKKLIYVSLFTAILFVQEELLTFIPDVQFTFMLVMLYGATMGPLYGSLIVILHVIFDNLFMSTFGNFWIMAPQLLGLLITMMFGYLLRRRNEFVVAIFSVIAGLIYVGLYMLVNIYVLDMDPLAYIIADIPVDLLLVTSNVITVMFLYKPLKKLIDENLNNEKKIEDLFQEIDEQEQSV